MKIDGGFGANVVLEGRFGSSRQEKKESPSSSEAAQLADTGAHSEAIDWDRINELRQKIAEGSLEINYEKIADAFLRDEKMLSGNY
ncbi:flagellar biosynthesis anti-sigma factor FlgM [Pseudomonas nitritireducens]|uniref:Negative regulator of flagellin synthesis n=1 Tax=Pseudomonas nitroreducens TaxID=46680 RepID=A0A7W7KM49_PSENT|nr:flagellar biosynthesis anti-sigma factor FlgM [Pseudomonas nitritireducens]MBB4865360.1 flagellar biosynthesis anti-sigma factor FlgM [Pseudomonas nitritireducens]